MKAARRGGHAATCGWLVWGKPNGFSLIGRAICHSWDGLQGRILPLKGSGETGIEWGGVIRERTTRSNQISTRALLQSTCAACFLNDEWKHKKWKLLRLQEQLGNELMPSFLPTSCFQSCVKRTSYFGIFPVRNWILGNNITGGVFRASARKRQFYLMGEI